MKKFLHKALRRFGVDVVRYPHCDASACHARLLRDLLSSHSIDLVLDVGANVGQFGHLLRRCGYQGDILSLEPVSQCYKELRAECEREPNWQCRRIALGSQAGTRLIYRRADSTFSSFLRNSSTGAHRFPDSMLEVEPESVTVMKGDDLIAEVLGKEDANKRIFLKSDAQGMDLEVISGCKGWLAQCGLLQVELSVRHIYDGMPDWLSETQEIRDMGYELAGIFPVSYTKDSEVMELDALFVRDRPGEHAE